jgi:hypothetical protein
MSAPESERLVARAVLPSLVRLTVAGAVAWALGTWLTELAGERASVRELLAAGAGWLLTMAGRGMAVGTGILALLVGLHWAVNTAIARSRSPKAEVSREVVVVDYSWPWKIIGFATLAMAAFFGVVVTASSDDLTTDVTVTAMFTLAGVAALYAFNLSEVRVWSYGLEVVRPFRGRHLAWSTIDRSYMKNDYLVLVPQDRPLLRLSIHMRNIDHLFQELERRHLAPAPSADSALHRT